MPDHKVHKYQLVYLGRKVKGRGTNKKIIKEGTPVWRCMLLNCPHYLSDSDLLVGRVSECWKCGKPFEIKRFNMERVRPTCNECRGEKSKIIEEVKEKQDVIEATLEELISGLNLK